MAAPFRRHCEIHGPYAAARARAEVHRLAQEAWLAGGTVEQTVEDDAVLVVSELVGNAVRHAGGACSLDLAFGPAGIDIDVSDPNPEPPRPRSIETTSEGGRGWGIVSRLTSELTVQGDQRGKTVHAHIDLGS
ncbi:ATP-binding protein [Streptomyces sp. NPDC101191]|uniref:ATP-binding protein n=1 Tax=Streptomyces sp. NPDC101191 TaxID=3366126 RepID=UPI0037FAE140